MNAQLTEIMRLITNLIRTGTVTEVDREKWLCRVKVGELETNWINWLTLRAGGARRGGHFFVEEVGTCRFTDSLTVDDLVADIATIFHWPPSVTDVMPLTEVLEWRYKAIQRSGASDER